MLKNFFITFVLVLISVELSAQLVINEVSQGPGGNPPSEYVELVVVGTKTCTDSCISLQNWIIDDNNGFFGSNGIAGGHLRFNADPQWQCMPYGTIIVIYNATNPYTGIVIDETDANNDNIYFLPSNSTFFEKDLTVPVGGTVSSTYAGSVYSAGGPSWGALGMQNGNDVFQTVSPTNLMAAYHSVGWGSSAGMDITFVGSASGLLFQNENILNNNPYTQVNWASQSETFGSPGVGNSFANTTWINNMQNSAQSIETTINETICDGDSFFFDNQYLHLLGTYQDTLVSALACDSIITLNLNIQVCTNCAMDIGNDTLICGPVNILLDAGIFDEYLWQNNSTNSTFLATSTGTFWCQGSNFDTTNLVVNSGFESGNVNFTTDYIVGTGGTWGQLSNPGTYAVSTSPNLVHNNFQFCNDHTSGTGNMMVVNGSNTPNQSVWCQTITVTPNTDYYFSIWAMSVENTNPTNVASLFFELNGTQIGTNFSPSLTACNWQQYNQTWNSGASITADLCIYNHTITGNNDFAIDDIFFGEVCTVSDTLNISNTPANIISDTIEICFNDSTLVFGQMQGITGIYNDTILTTLGCDSLYYQTELIVGGSLFSNQDIFLCFSDSIFLENAWQNTSNVYIDTVQATNTCDSLVYTNLTVFAAPTSDTSIVCSNNPINVGFVVISTIPNYFACDSFINVQQVIYIKLDTIPLAPIEICIGESVSIFGVNQSQSGEYVDPNAILSVGLCDSLTYIQELIVNPLPNVFAGNDITIEIEESVILQATGAQTYSWNNGETNSILNITPQETFNYVVLGTDSNTCSSYDSVMVIVLFPAVNIFLPTAFSPNGDGVNDLFRIVNETDFEEISLSIYNRWGEAVFESDINYTYWDGDYKGTPQPIESYIYNIQATAKKNKQQFKVSGSVTLIR